jgi:CHAT domain-containing protein
VSRVLTSDRPLVVGSPAYEELGATAPEPLTDAMSEASAVAARFQESTLLSGNQATWRVMREYFPNSNIFHFAGHAYVSADGVHLMLAPSSAHDDREASDLTADRLAAMSLRQYKLFVLSGCETARSGEASLADPESLVGTLLAGGVRSVVASRWRVDSATTAILMNSFYDAILSGQTVPAALRTAAQTLRNQHGRWHPYYWAAFESYGNALSD